MNSSGGQLPINIRKRAGVSNERFAITKPSKRKSSSWVELARTHQLRLHHGLLLTGCQATLCQPRVCIDSVLTAPDAINRAYGLDASGFIIDGAGPFDRRFRRALRGQDGKEFLLISKREPRRTQVQSHLTMGAEMPCAPQG